MFWKQADYWPEIGKDYETLTEPYSENDFNDTFKFLRKMCIMSQLFRKYIKVDKSAYVCSDTYDGTTLIVWELLY